MISFYILPSLWSTFSRARMRNNRHMKTLPRRFKNGFQEGSTASKNGPKVSKSIEECLGCVRGVCAVCA